MLNECVVEAQTSTSEASHVLDECFSQKADGSPLPEEEIPKDLVTNSFEVHSQGANGTRAYNGHQNQPQPRLNTLTRRKRQNTDDSDIYLDYVILKHLETTLGRLQQQNVIRLNDSLLSTIYAVLRNYASQTHLYKVLTKQVDDNIGACDFFNKMVWWRIEIPLPGSDTNVRILDLMLETPLRYCYRWLCENHYLISRRSPNELAGFGLRILQQQDFYRILTEGEDEVTDLERSLSRHNWWTQEGEIDVEDGQLTWST
ncbi:uncharacterized protein LOC119647126 [Hermetia illucens]|uniref:uncharacterized protein LOC119647126 n=1 Tax=Hermetia illucens TaxID=343691 RepID=UPI0018CC166A|nr:uncharacterized protein LOC119647126 [Hermetia illucens]